MEIKDKMSELHQDMYLYLWLLQDILIKSVCLSELC